VARPARLPVDCPRCADPGRTVANLTVRSLVRESSRDGLGEGDYNLCLNPACEVVYYDGSHPPLTRAEIAVRIGFKQTEGRRPICYCYDLTSEDVVAEMRRNPRARSFASVASIFGMDDCRCELHHPFGGHCACARVVASGTLPDFMTAVEMIDRALPTH
jgi:hypothetical protein